MDLSKKILDQSIHLGMEITGIINANPLYKLKPHLEKRIQAGLASPFENKFIEKRINPRQSLPGCQSIICFALSYLTASKSPPANNEPYGKVAEFARGKDYHSVLQEKAFQLIKYIEKFYPSTFNFFISVDTSPLLERAFIHKAGGELGENTTFLSPFSGSWVSLGMILTDIPLSPHKITPPSPPCLNCGLCRESCPTGALFAPFQIDPWRCLSFITQNKGIIPRAFRKSLGVKLYGCDTCQEVCTRNRKIDKNQLKNLNPPILPDELPLIACSNMSKENFKKTFGHTAANWRGRQILRRNAIVAMGNSKNINVIKPLTNLLQNDPSPIIRLHSAWSLGQYKENEAKQALDSCFRRENNVEVRQEIVTSLNEIGAME